MMFEWCISKFHRLIVQDWNNFFFFHELHTVKYRLGGVDFGGVYREVGSNGQRMGFDRNHKKNKSHGSEELCRRVCGLCLHGRGRVSGPLCL